MYDAGYWLARLAFKRGLALVYLIAFLAALNQFRPLLGERGLLPVARYVKQVSFRETPSLFYLFPKDAAFAAAAWVGIVLSCLALVGLADRYSTWLSMVAWFLMWLLYLSFVNVGQTFYAFGWESILLEAGFIAIFLGSANVPPSRIMIWVLRWLLFRVMFGAGLIKLRGDPCWRDFTCLDYHYETQPMPNLLSWYFHNAPAWTRHWGVGVNHFAELIVPFGYFAPQPIASIAGIITIVFQGLIMASGNLSWLNLLTMVLALGTLDERVLGLVIPSQPGPLHDTHVVQRYVVIAVGVLVALLSIKPIGNMLSPRQIMNTSYNPLHLVGTYGAFGGITRERYQIIVEGTDEAVLLPSTKWRAYEFKGQPGDPSRSPPQIAPYHLRLDWLMWFASMSEYYRNPWFVHFVVKLLEGDGATIGLLRSSPFGSKSPRFIRAQLYEYQFTTWSERRETGMWWKRVLVGEYLRPVSLETPGVREIVGSRK